MMEKIDKTKTLLDPILKIIVNERFPLHILYSKDDE
jgi:hypothetical protein